MYQLKIGNIPLPVIYVCEKNESRKCRDLGVPYIIRPEGMDDATLVKAFLYWPLRKRFPHLPWTVILGLYYEPRLKINVPHETIVSTDYRENDGLGLLVEGNVGEGMEVSDGYRLTGGGADVECHVEMTYERQGVYDWFEDGNYYVDIETLQQLHLLPTFLDDIATAVKRNLIGLQWADGWNKKLDCNMGRYDSGTEAPNLIILDVSGSIPRGVSATMVTLIDTLRTQANADLIITGHCSQYWKSGDELPNPRKLARLCGGCNERTQFYKILREHILGRHWGNVIVFGDNDAPADVRFDKDDRFKFGHLDTLTDNELQRTKIDNLLCFHTYDSQMVPGYGRWAEACTPKGAVKIDTTWKKTMSW